MITLVDEKRQWFKSKVGTISSETPRDISFCAHAILQESLFIVPDATKDKRFAQNPLVMSEPQDSLLCRRAFDHAGWSCPGHALRDRQNAAHTAPRPEASAAKS